MSERKLKLSAALFSIVLVCGGTLYAQNINDDLKPSPTAKSKTTVKATRKAVASPKQNTAKPKAATVRPSRSSDDYRSNAETPEQIINRYMSFQQSTSVTVQDWKSIIAQTAKTLQENPNHSTAKAQSLIAQGQIAYNQRSYPSAISYFKSALQILPDSSLPQYSLGKVYLANGQAKAAEQAFKEAIDQNEDFALAYKGMGDALAAQGESKKAVKYFKKATEASVRKGSLP